MAIFIALLAFFLGLLVPRDIAPMQKLSAFLMRHSDNKKLAAWVVGGVAGLLLLLVALS